MICKSCGFENPDNALFCNMCGGRLETTSEEAESVKKSEEKTELTEKTEPTEESIIDENSSEETESNENDYSIL